MHPQRHRSYGQRYANFGGASRREGPIQSRAHLSDLTTVARQPPGRGQCLRLRFGSLQKIPVVVGVASCHIAELTAFTELLARVGARGLMQPLVRNHANAIQAATRLAASAVKSPAKIARRRMTRRSGSGSKS